MHRVHTSLSLCWKIGANRNDAIILCKTFVHMQHVVTCHKMIILTKWLRSASLNGNMLMQFCTSMYICTKNNL
jgi:hypothetical protein